MPKSSESQRGRFIETARALGADEDEAAFKDKLAMIARQKPAQSTGAKDQVPQASDKGHKRGAPKKAAD